MKLKYWYLLVFILQVITSLLMLLIDDLSILILYGSFSDFLFTSIAISSIFYFRLTRPNAIRPIKVFISNKQTVLKKLWINFQFTGLHYISNYIYDYLCIFDWFNVLSKSKGDFSWIFIFVNWYTCLLYCYCSEK